MKKLALLILVLATATLGRAQMVTIDISLGELRDAGNSPLANGALLQLIASPDDTFTSPTGTSFVAGNDLVVATLALDSSTYFDLPGYTQLNQIVNLTTYPIASQFLVVRWYPTLTTAATAPGFITAFGQYGYPNDPLWIAPSAGGTLTLDASAIASPTNVASLTTAAIPEPSTYALLAGLAGLGMAAWRRFKSSPQP